MRRGERVNAFDLIVRVLAERLQRAEASEGLRDLSISRLSTRWEDVVTRASNEFVLPAFAAAVRDLGLLESLEPKPRAFLAITHAANIERNRRLREELVALVNVLNKAVIEPVLLKGAIRLLDGLYPDPGWRRMQDLDVLVAKDEFSDALAALHEAGYVTARQVAPQRKDVPLQRQGHSLTIELHKELFSTSRRERLLRSAEMIGESRPIAVDGAKARVPSIEHQLVHLIGHSQIGHRGHAYGRIALRERLEAAALIRWLPERIDWDAVFTRFAAAGYRRPLQAFLLSLNDGGLCPLPVAGRIDALTAIQQRRIAVQARCRTMTRLSLYTVWYTVVLKMQFTEGEARRPKVIETLRKLVVDREERRRIAQIFVQGAPRPW